MNTQSALRDVIRALQDLTIALKRAHPTEDHGTHHALERLKNACSVLDLCLLHDHLRGKDGAHIRPGEAPSD